MTGDIASDIAHERERQNQKWGVQRHSWPEWIAILTEETGEAAQAAVNEHWHPTGDLSKLREELVQTAAVAVQIIEHIDEVTAKQSQEAKYKEELAKMVCCFCGRGSNDEDGKVIYLGHQAYGHHDCYWCVNEEDDDDE